MWKTESCLSRKTFARPFGCAVRQAAARSNHTTRLYNDAEAEKVVHMEYHTIDLNNTVLHELKQMVELEGLLRPVHARHG